MRAFRRQYPEVELGLEEIPTAALLERLHGGHLDCAFIRPGRCDPDGVRLHPLGEEPFVAVLPASHPLAKTVSFPLSKLARETFALFARQAGPSLFDELLAACREAGFEPILGQETPQIASVAHLVAAGLGASLVPRSVSAVRVEGVKYLPLRGKAPVARLALVTALEVRSVVVRQFVEMVEAQKGSRLNEAEKVTG